MLKEGVDVTSLGAVDSSHPRHEFASPTPPQKEMRTPRAPQAPATPVVVPPTPSPAPPSTTTRASSSSSNEVFYDAEDTDMPSKRRSIYRSPGTSSSPDLATLVRKAKERGTVVPANLVQSQKEKRPEPPPPLPNHARASPATATAPNTLRSTRPRSSTSGANTNCPPPPKLSITPAPYKSSARSARSARDPTSPNSSDWVMPSPRSRTSSKAGSDKVSRFPFFFFHYSTVSIHQLSKNSVKAKTSAFLGRMLGQSMSRERSVRQLLRVQLVF